MKPQHLAMMLLVQLIWGVNFVAAKIGLAHFESLFFLALRFSLVALLLLPFVVALVGLWAWWNDRDEKE